MSVLFKTQKLGNIPFWSMIIIIIHYSLHEKSLQQKLKIDRHENECIKIHWVGLIFQGVVSEFNSAPQMYLAAFFELFHGREFPGGSGDFVPSF